MSLLDRRPDHPAEHPASEPDRKPDKSTVLEKKEGELWRVSLLILLLLATVVLGSFWETARLLPSRTVRELAAMPATVVLILTLAAYIWRKRREILELRAYVRGMQHSADAPPSPEQIERLLEIVSKSQQGYRDLIDSLDDIVFTCSLNGEINAVNRACTDLANHSFTELVGQSLDRFVEEPKRSTLERALPRFIEKRIWTGVARVRIRKTGRTHYLDCTVRAIVKEGQVTGASCLARDITRQRESESRFTDLFETLQEGVYFTTPEGRILDANPALVRMLGYANKEELMELNAGTFYLDPDVRTGMLKDLEDQGTLRDREIHLRRKDGSTLVCLDTTSAIHDPTGRVVRYQGTLVDITERRRMEQRLHEEQEFARRLVESFPDLIVVVGTDEQYRYVSPRIRELLGYTPEELIGRKVGERSAPDGSRAMLMLCRDLLSGKKKFGGLEYRTQHKDGSWRTFRAAVSPLYDSHGKITGLIASSRDVTDLKLLEQQVIQSEKLAAMGQLVAGVAHELNNPLTAILGISDLLIERASDPAGRRQLELVNEQARRAAGIVQNLLAFSRPSAQHKTAINLNDLVQRTLQLHEYSLRVKNVALDFKSQPGLPLVIGDTNQLMQVMINLIVNAEQAVQEKKGSGALKVRLGENGAAGPSRVWVSFEDDGPGIAPEIESRIFDPFFTTKRPGRGTGLGLSICLALVREHRGNIEVASRYGFGTTFTVALPVPSDSEIEALHRSADALPAGMKPDRTNPALRENILASNKLEGHSVLVVDDEESIRELLQNGLSARGLSVDCAASGEQALARTAGRSYDAIVCDVKMPGLNGEQVFMQMRARPGCENQKFVFMTGDLMDTETTVFLRKAGVRSVQKPFRVTDLIGVLTEVLEGPSRKDTSRRVN